MLLRVFVELAGKRWEVLCTIPNEAFVEKLFRYAAESGLLIQDVSKMPCLAVMGKELRFNIINRVFRYEGHDYLLYGMDQKVRIYTEEDAEKMDVDP